MDEIAQQYVQTLPDARRTLINKVRAFSFLAKMMIASPLDTEKFERSREQPMPVTPKFAMDDNLWRADHPAEHRTQIVGAAKPQAAE